METAYRLRIEANGDVISTNSIGAARTVDLDTLGLGIEFGASVSWWVEAISGDDTLECNARFTFRVLGVSDEDELMPVKFGIQSIYPNPFNAQMTVRFNVETPSRTSLIAYNLSGRAVAVLYNDIPKVGSRKVVWDASGLAAGIYLLELRSGSCIEVVKAVLVK